MQLQLDGGVVAEVVPDRMLDRLPRWGLEVEAVSIGHYRNSAEHEQHVLNTFRSGSWLWSVNNELRFGKDDRTLCSVLMHIPEINYSLVDADPERWLDKECAPGLLRTQAPITFASQVAATRYLASSNGGALIGILGPAVAPPAETLRLRIAIDFDLVFAKGMLCGWVLSRPARYLVSSWEQPLATPPSQRFVDCLKEYVELVAEPHLEQMENGDEGPRQALLRLLDRVRTDPARDERNAALANKVQSVLEILCGLSF